jgi:dihydroxy-acid dehydratase
MVYGATICTGKQPSNGNTLDIVSAFQAYGQSLYDKITEEEWKEIIQHSCPGPRACGGMYTANTMATAIEALGMSLPYSSSSPADSQEKREECALLTDRRFSGGSHGFCISHITPEAQVVGLLRL